MRVEHEAGVWCDGYLESYRQAEGMWSGFVLYSTGPGVNYLGWFEEPRIRSSDGRLKTGDATLVISIIALSISILVALWNVLMYFLNGAGFEYDSATANWMSRA